MRKSVLLLCVIYTAFFIFSVNFYQSRTLTPQVTDKGRLLPVTVKAIKSSTSDSELKQIVVSAMKNEDSISIAGMQHSQGGQTLYPNGIMLDMKPYKKILDFNEEKKTITVQSGATWEDIQEYINPYGLALKVTQSQNIFTVGGSLSVNVHGRDIRHEALIETVDSFRLMNSSGEVLVVSRNENPELFRCVIGGYGLFGIILDVTLYLTDDELYMTHTKSMSYNAYEDYFTKDVLGNESVKMHIARLSVAPDTFFTKMYVTDYVLADNQENLQDYDTLKREKIIAVPKFFLGLSRLNGWGKNVFWSVQETFNNKQNRDYISRNNVMRSDSTFMDYDSSVNTEILQEYFVPVDQFSNYVDDLRKTLETEKDFNLLNITIRYVEKNDEALMSYAKEDMFAFVLLINQGKSKKDIQQTEKVIRKMIDVTLAYDGSYYLPYYSYPSKEQLLKAYPNTEDFFQLKKKYDPEERFINLFYEEYSK